MTRAWEELLDQARADALVGERVRERWLGQQAAASATLVGALLDLAESGAGVTIGVRGGRRHDGTIAALGTDVLVLAERGAQVAVPLPALKTVRPLPGGGSGVATGDRPAALDLTFGEIVARIAADRPDGWICLGDGETLSGVVLAVGVDVLSLRVAPGADGIAYVSMSAVSSIRLG